MMKKTSLKLWTLGLTAVLGFAGVACNTEEKLPDLGEKISGASDIVTSPSGRYFYVLNSDYERRFNKGSILIIDSEASEASQKVKAIKTPRMGRSLAVGQGLLFATYTDPQARESGTLEIWDLTNETDPVLLTSTPIPCQPLNGIIAPTLPYAAVSCKGGWIYMLKNPRGSAAAPTTLDLVRGYELDKRAIYFHETAGKAYLFGFPTDLDRPDYADQPLVDAKTYDIATDALKDGANGVPDRFEETEAARRRTILAAPYQMFIYPVSDEETASKEPQNASVPPFQTFRYIAPGTFLKPSLSNQELHYIHYILLQTNGQPSASEAITDPNTARYRTNFWEAKIGPENNGAIFYLSQRGDYGSESNNVLRVEVNSDSLANAKSLKFEDLFTVNRVYGFDIDRDNSGRFPGDFEFSTLEGQSLLFINSFRDSFYYSTAPFYSITRKSLDEPAFSAEVPSSYNSTEFNGSKSFYTLAISQNGKVLSSSFYGNALYLFNGAPSASIKDQTPQRIE